MTSPHRVRVRYAKSGDLRMISHRDLVRALERLFRRAGIELAMSQGFHPRPLMTFPDALSLGIEAHDEVMDLGLVNPCQPQEMLEQLQRHAQHGLVIRSVSTLAAGEPKARLKSVVYQLTLPAEHLNDALHVAISNLRQETKLQVERRGEQIEIDLKATLQDLRLDDARITMVIRATNHKQLQPRDILAALGLHELVTEGAVLTRTKVELAT